MLTRRNIIIAAVVAVVLIITILFSVNSYNSKPKDLGDGFKETKTTVVQTTTPSKAPTISQPCSLLSKAEAASVLKVATSKIKNVEASVIEDKTLRCRYGALSDDESLYLVLNVFVYKDQAAYNKVKKVNKGTDIDTNVDEGFTYASVSNKESERYVAARQGTHRIAVSAIISIVDSKDKLSAQQKEMIPTLDVIANNVGLILGKVQN